MSTHQITVFYHWANDRSCPLWYMPKMLLFNTTYAFGGWIKRAPAFFRFFIKRIKGWPAWKKAGKLKVSVYFILLVTQHRPQQTPGSLIFLFRRTALLTGKLIMSWNNPLLSIFDDLRYCPGVHELVPVGKQSKCKYCQYLVLVMKNRKEAPTAEKRPWLQWNICNIHLCKDHFDVFHKKQYE